MAKPKTHNRLDITLPIDMIAELKKPDYGPVSQFIRKAVDEKMERQMTKRFCKETRKRGKN